MILKYTYPVINKFLIQESWPIKVGEYEINFDILDGQATSLIIAVTTKDLSFLPTVKTSSDPKIAVEINFGLDPFQDGVESVVRTALGILELYGRLEVNFENAKVTWEAETDEERNRMQMFSFQMNGRKEFKPIAIPYDLVARCFLNSENSLDAEIPLRFLSKGKKHLRSQEFIEAFYNLFFFFETQYAPGYSDPKKVSSKFRSSNQITEFLADARKLTKEMHGSKANFGKILSLTDDQIIEHLIKVRGKLHHHALPRKTDSWHPEKHTEFEAEAYFLSYLAYAISNSRFTDQLYSDSINSAVQESATLAGARYELITDATGETTQGNPATLPRLHTRTLSFIPSHSAISDLNRSLRDKRSPYDGKFVKSYTIKSSTDGATLAYYHNNLSLNFI